MPAVATVAALAAFSLAVVLLVAVLPPWLAVRKARTRHTRRGGYLRHPVSAPTKVGGLRIRETAITGPISSSNQRGFLLTVGDILIPPVPPSKPIAHGLSGNATEAAGASGARALAERVGSPEYGGDAA